MSVKLPTIRIVAVALATAVMGQPAPSGAQDSGLRTDPHMKTTAPRSATPEDSTRAWTVVETLRRELACVTWASASPPAG
ncbi:MAG TPA: hypothetical protein VFG78_04635 [Gemmatimonadota bacterium]|nr:hypothetical protein [Gemmatimonadota bacterium]